MKLISMTDFVLYKKESHTQIMKYAKFLKQPLTLGMFIPCDEEQCMIDVNYRYTSDYEHLNKELDKRYEKAKERVLFKIIKPRLINKNLFLYESYIYYSEGLVYENNDGRSLELIEDLISFTDLTLTETAIKQIGL